MHLRPRDMCSRTPAPLCALTTAEQVEIVVAKGPRHVTSINSIQGVRSIQIPSQIHILFGETEPHISCLDLTVLVAVSGRGRCIVIRIADRNSHYAYGNGPATAVNTESFEKVANRTSPHIFINMPCTLILLLHIINTAKHIYKQIVWKEDVTYPIGHL